MIEQQKLVKKLYLDKGLTIAEIADILEDSEVEIKDVLEKVAKYNISTSVSNYTFQKLADKDYVRLRKSSLSIKPMYMFSLEMSRYLERFDISGVPEIYAMLAYFFGESSDRYDNYKSSFTYPFLLEIYSENSQELDSQYIVSIMDIKGGMQVEFYKIAKDREEDDYSIYHKSFSELNQKEMKRIWFWFMAFVKNGLDYLKENDLEIKPFCRTINYRNIIYGYKEGRFFAEEYLEPQDGKEARDIFQETYEEYKKQVAKEFEERNYKNRSSQFIFEIIKETNQYSLPNYKFNNLSFKFYKEGYKQFLTLDFLDQDQASEMADSLSSMLIRYRFYRQKTRLACPLAECRYFLCN